LLRSHGEHPDRDKAEARLLRPKIPKKNQNYRTSGNLNNKSEPRACRHRLFRTTPKVWVNSALNCSFRGEKAKAMELREWVQQKITEFDLDVEVYTSYVMGIVDEETTDVSEKQAAVIELLVAATVS